MLYSAADAPISWAAIFFIFPHLVIGGVLLWASLRKRVWLRNFEGTIGLVLQTLVGGLFFSIAVWVLATGFLETIWCRTAVEKAHTTIIQGPIVIQKRFEKPGSGYVRFSVDGHAFRTRTQGFSCDCGFLQPLGKSVAILDGQNVRVQAQGAKVLAMETLQ
ncbi:MAG: hypothetical protein JNN20_00410 [Betaproteobacteria bacterium]|nr:hypothetical protein [Betaproteobacteria bacterium]